MNTNPKLPTPLPSREDAATVARYYGAETAGTILRAYADGALLTPEEVEQAKEEAQERLVDDVCMWLIDTKHSHRTVDGFNLQFRRDPQDHKTLPTPELHEAIERDWQRQRERQDLALSDEEVDHLVQDACRDDDQLPDIDAMRILLDMDGGHVEALRHLIDAVERLYLERTEVPPGHATLLDLIDDLREDIRSLEKLTDSQLIGGDGTTHWYRMEALEERLASLERRMEDRGRRIVSLEERVLELEQRTRGQQRVGGFTASDVRDPRG